MSYPIFSSRVFRWGIASLSLLGSFAAQAQPVDNVVANADFEEGAWRFYAPKGKGSATVSAEDGYKGTPSLVLRGETADTLVRSFSEEIAVVPGASYDLDFAYKLSYGSGSLSLRWQGGGYVISLSKTTEGWTTFAQEQEGKTSRLHGILYTQGLGSRHGRKPFNGTTIVIPPDVTQLQVYVVLKGEGALSVDALRLVPLEAPPAPSSRAAASGAGLSAIDQDEMNRLLIAEQPLAAGQRQTVSTVGKRNLEIRDVVLPESYEMDPAVASWPASASNIRIDGDQFVRADDPQRAVFLIGFESTVVYPWLYRLLGADFVHFQDPCTAAVLHTRKDGDVREVWWEDYEWLDVQLRRILSAGLAAHVQPFEELRDVHMRHPERAGPLYLEYPDMYVNKSHFISYRFEDPDGRRLRENMWRSILGVTRKYPIFSYELFNEVRYSDYSEANIAGLRKAMEEKYGTIARANAAWGTDFGSFAEMTPPEKSNNAGGTLIGLSPRGFSVPLWVDWQKYLEQTFAGHIAELGSFIRSVDTSPNVYLTIQSTCELNQGYSGGNGVYPPLKVAAESFYGAEGNGGAYISQKGGDNFNEIRSMLVPGMTEKLTGFVSEGKPVVDIEVAPAGYGRSPIPGTRLVELDESWTFCVDNDRVGEQLGYASPEFDASAWVPIKVPGLWGPQGFEDCSFGWYRTRFRLPEGSGSVYLNGSTLSDKAELYVNGQRVHRTQSWNERFGVDITPWLHTDPQQENTIVVSIENNYKDAGMFWGGIRDYLSLDDRPYAGIAPLTAGQARSFLWQKLVHGANGLVPSYAYTGEGDHLSIFNPKKVSAEAIRAFPLTAQEIANVGDIALRQNRRLEPLGLLYSFESGRARVPKDNSEWVRADAMKDLASWYAALSFSQLPHNVIHNEGILSGRSDSQSVILVRMAPRLLDGTLEKLEALARSGKTIVIDHGSAQTNDDTHAPLDLTAFAGIEVGAPRTTPASVSAGSLLPVTATTVPRLSDAHTGQHIRLATGADGEETVAVLQYADGTPALTRRAVGKGAIYYLAAELPQETLQPLLQGLISTALEPDARAHAAASAIRIERNSNTAKPLYIEAGLFAGEDAEEWLAYLHNWGDDASVKVHLPAFSRLATDRWRVRTLDFENPAESAEVVLTTADLEEGLALDVPCQNPVLLLIEPAQSEPRKLEPLPAVHLARLNELLPVKDSTTSLERPRILFGAYRAETMTPIRMVTAMSLLNARGYDFAVNMEEFAPEVQTFVGALGSFKKENLADYAMVTTLGNATGKRRFTEAEIETLQAYVANGGGLLIAANQFVGPHGWLSNTTGKGNLAAAFGLSTSHKNIIDASAGTDGVAMHPVLVAAPRSAAHPVLKGVARIDSLGSSVVRAGKNGTVLLRSGRDATPANAPAAVALEYGKGRVVLLGDAKWMESDTLERADNARFLLNIVDWLTKRDGEPSPLSDAQVATLIDARLE